MVPLIKIFFKDLLIFKKLDQSVNYSLNQRQSSTGYCKINGYSQKISLRKLVIFIAKFVINGSIE